MGLGAAARRTSAPHAPRRPRSSVAERHEQPPAGADAEANPYPDCRAINAAAPAANPDPEPGCGAINANANANAGCGAISADADADAGRGGINVAAAGANPNPESEPESKSESEPGCGAISADADADPGCGGFGADAGFVVIAAGGRCLARRASRQSLAAPVAERFFETCSAPSRD